MTSKHRQHLFAWSVGLGLICLSATITYSRRPDAPASRAELISRAIGQEDAIVLVASARTGRLLASHNLQEARTLRMLPGSAIKPWTALALLRSGVVTPNDRIEDHRIVPAFGPRFACSHPPQGRPFGLKTALAQSCNYFFLTFSERLQQEYWTNTLASYGLHPDQNISGVQFPLMAIGAEGIHLTPWNLLQAWRKLVWQINHSDDPNLRIVQQGLIDCVRNGTGQEAQVPGVQVMGKTGTVSEVPDGRTHAWFLAAAPADNPRLLILVATARGSGEHDAAVIAGRLLRSWLSRPQEDESGGENQAGMSKVPANQPSGLGTNVLTTSGNAQRSNGEETNNALRKATSPGSTTQHVPADADRVLLQLIPPVSALRLRLHSSATIEFHSGDSVWTVRDAIVAGERNGWSVSSLSRTYVSKEAQLELDGAAPIQITIGSRHLMAPPNLILRQSDGRGEVLARLGMDAYVAGVVAGEASEMPYPGQQAMAVLARTWARTHMGRHRQQGFDFCTTTHCQVWRWAKPGSAPWRADLSTRGVEVDYHGQPAQVFYSANCGGKTEAGGPPFTSQPEPYLVSQPDPYCLRHPRLWTFRIARAQLARWLVREGLFRHDPSELRIHVIKRDRSGRAVLLSLAGPPVKIVSADSFRFDVDRSFGWNRIESTLFTVRQSGDSIIFSGHGLGHGVGLCQAGASAMARQGYSWQAILAHYFPGTQLVDRLKKDSSRRPEAPGPSATARSSQGSQGKSKTFFKPTAYESPPVSQATAPRWHFLVDGSCQIRYDGSRPAGVIEWCPPLLLRAQSLLDRQVKGPIHLIVYSSPAEFIAATGEPGWKAAVTRGNTIRLQPESWLRRRGRFRDVLLHELVLAVMQPRLMPGADACAQEGLVLALTGEGSRLTPVSVRTNMSESRLNERLLRAGSAGEFASALDACYQLTKQNLRQFGRRAYLNRMLR